MRNREINFLQYNIKLEKGNDYRLLVQLNHTNVTFLEKFKELTIVVKQKLPQSITNVAYMNMDAAIHENGRKFGTVGLRPGQNCMAYFTPISDDKFYY